MNSKKVLITGARGFIGSALVRFLAHAGHRPQAATIELTDKASVFSEVARGPWDVVIHLAAMSHVPTCTENPEKAFQVNVEGTQNLLESLQAYSPQAHLIFASTAQVYAVPSSSDIIYQEDHPIQPQNIYASTKIEAEGLISKFSKENGNRATVLRLFNHTHKTQSPNFFLPHVYSSLKKGSSNSTVEITVGNLDLYRDIGSLSDLLQAFLTIIDTKVAKSELEIFNVCNGSRRHLKSLVQTLAQAMSVKATFLTDPKRVRPGETKSICGSHDKLSRTYDWHPKDLTNEALIQSFLADLVF